MAVTVTVKRSKQQEALRGGSTEFCTANLSGTYVTGGFTFNPAIYSSLGSSPEPGSIVLGVQWMSPTGYIYASTTTKTGFVNSTVTKIYSAPGTELANGTAVPDAVVPLIIYKTRE